MSSPASAAGEDLVSLAERAGRLADMTGLTDLSSRLRAAHSGAKEGLPRVVVGGEEKRGKSSLVNALVGRPLLSPVGDDVVTATFVVFMPGDRDEAVVIVVDGRTGAARRVPIGLTELADYVSVDATHDGVIGAEVHLDAPLLRDMALVDTPGVGGLDSGLSAITMSTLDTAHALLFVMDAAAPLSAPELRFLAQAVDRNDAVVLAMTKTDLYPEWNRIRDDDRELIARHVPQLADAPIVPMSSRLAEQAGRLAHNPDAAAQVLRVSGLEGLVGELKERVAARLETVSLAHRAQALHALLAELRARLSERPEYVIGEPGELAELIAERDRLESFLTDPHHGALHVHRRMTRIRRDAEQNFALRASDLCKRYAASLDSYPSGELQQVPALLRGELAQLVADSIDEVDRELYDILYGLEQRIGSAVVLDRLRTLLEQEAQVDLSDHREGNNWGSYTASAGGHTVGLAGSMIFGGILAMGAAMIAVGVAALATFGLREFISSRASTRQQSLRLWLERVERDVGRSFDQALGSRLDELERIMNSELPRLFRDRVARIERLTSLTADSPARPDGITLADVDQLISQVSAVLAPVRKG
ncbi:dynamin family protein [Blastococcus deserti]|uniref:Dynamin family protein n=1 Tax=Blastococcus deserti TaxID=2259033 RepID=A0ABW4XCQ8_9ACTN